MNERRLELDGREEGLLWLVVKTGLHDYEADLQKAFAAQTYEMKVAILSAVARKIADNLSARLQPWAQVPDAS